MDRSLFSVNFSINGITKLVLGVRLLPRIILPTLLGSFLLMTPAQASDPQIDIVETWVEDGFGFYVAFEASPTNDSCSITGEGLIEFEVAYSAPNNSGGVESVFGLAIWPPNSDNETTVLTQGKANGSSAHCWKSSPCRIKDVIVVKTWCPISEEEIWPSWADSL